MGKAKHLSASEREQDRNKKRRTKRIVLSILLVVLVAGVVAEVLILKSMTSVDRLFLRAVERGVTTGWEEGKADLQLKENGRVTDTSFIQKELEAVEDFRNRAYQDKELGKLAKTYIAALKRCSSVAETYDPAGDGGEFWDNFSQPYTDRLVVLRKLYTGEYIRDGAWDDFPEMRDEVLLKGWVAETVGSLKFERTADAEKQKFTARLRNDSGTDIEYLNIEVKLYGSNDKIAATAEVIKEDIKDGREAELVFYYSGKDLSSYRINAVDCIAAERQEEEQEKE